MMKKILIALICMQCPLHVVHAQNISRKSISSAGGTFTNGSVQITYNIGETIIPTLSAGGNIITQGFEQPGEHLSSGNAPDTVCAGSSFLVNFTAIDIGGGNIFTVQLSDSVGSFATPVTIGSLSGNASGSITATIPPNTSPGNYRIRVVASYPQIAANPSVVFTTQICVLSFNLKVYIEGFASSFGAPQLPMSPALFMSGITMSDALCDTVRLDLVDPLSTGDIIESAYAVVDTGGNGSFTFSPAVLGGTYWLAVTHRNSIVTYSGAPVTISNSNYYDFTTSDMQSFGPNMKDIYGDGSAWALYTGDIFDAANTFDAGHDGSVDVFDYLILDVSIQAGDQGYFLADLNGDGAVDVFDYLIFDPNIQSGIQSLTPP